MFKLRLPINQNNKDKQKYWSFNIVLLQISKRLTFIKLMIMHNV